MAWTAPRTWVAGEVPTAATFNTHVRDNFKAIGDAWAAYVPTYGGITAIGNAVVTARYIQAGKHVEGLFKIVVGSTTTFAAADITVTLPVPGATVDIAVGTGLLFDASAGAPSRTPAVGLLLGGASAVLLVQEGGNGITNLLPWTWANGDILGCSFSYEAA